MIEEITKRAIVIGLNTGFRRLRVAACVIKTTAAEAALTGRQKVLTVRFVQSKNISLVKRRTKVR